MGTGFINITGVSGGSGNYVYHIGGPIDYNDPNAYNLNSSASGLSNGGYYVAVYDSSQLRYTVEYIYIDCPAAPTTTTTTTTPPPACYTYYNYTGIDQYDVNYVNCAGTEIFSGFVAADDYVCAQAMYSGFMTYVSPC
jgi:hypothetical protein